MKRILIAFAIMCSIALLGIQHAAGSAPPADEEAVRQAIQAAIDEQAESVLAYLLFDEHIEQIQFSADGKLARATLLTVDPDTDQPIEQEPGLAFARWDGSEWIAILPADPAWLEMVRTAPGELLNPEEKDYWLSTFQTYLSERPAAAIGGFYLPWEAGISRYLTQSIGHDQYTPSGTMHHAFDFALNRTHWPIHASRPGVLWMCKEDVPTCSDWTCNQTQKLGNYIVLKDESTTPVTYQLYLHVDFNSIPDNLCENNSPKVGAAVSQSQVIGIVDNTGQSWGAHLHFQVHTSSNHYFGDAIDILFKDVFINGGRPRVEKYDKAYCKPGDVCDSFQTYYTSGNTGSNDNIPPTGDITNITDGQSVTASTLSLTGQAADIGDGVSSVQFMAYYNEAWHDIGAAITTNPTSPALNWNWCSANGAPVPNGIVSVAMRIADRGANVNPFTGLHHVIKNYTCPAPPSGCNPNANQMALFSEPNYSGSCKLFSAGTYTTTTSLGNVGDNNAASLMVGSNVQATLFLDSGQTQRGETFLASDNNLADNWIGVDSTSALRVEADSPPPSAPLLRQPAQGGALTAGDIATFGWDNGGGAQQYQVVITDSTHTYTSPWISTPYSFTAALPAGSFTWQVLGKNQAGIGPRSAARSFTIGAAPAITTTQLSLPISETFEIANANWSGSGLWARSVVANHSPGGSWGWWYQNGGNYETGAANSGELTSVPISITSGGFYLRFYYQYESETHYGYWDQRWLQISSDGGPFVNVWQAGDDPSDIWLQSPPIDLAPYAGHSIRLRFHFDTLDANFNAFKGWGIDDLTITNTALPCSLDGDNSPASGTPLTDSNNPFGVICPNGDVDYYKFIGSAGDEIGANVDAQTLIPASALDSYLSLIGPDGVSVLAENDDQVLELNRDALIRFKLPANGTYYLKVRAWDHPSAGGTNYNYRIRLYKDATPPAVALTAPLSRSYLPIGSTLISATATDSGSGIESVAFYWHDQNWQTGAWQLIGVDSNSADGWGVPYTFSAPDQLDVAVIARATDQAGNEAVSGAWALILDHTPPVTELAPWNTTLGSTAILLYWSGSDNLSGLQRYDLQRQLNSGGWNETFTFTASTNQAWQVGQAGVITHTYTFRLRGLDNADNAEGYPAAPEVTAIIPPASSLCSQPDMWETDNTPISATLVTTDTQQLHNFCNPAAANFLNDEDWLQMAVAGQKAYIITVMPTDQSAAVVIEVYASDGTTLIAKAFPPRYGLPSLLAWSAPADGINYIRMRHVDGNVIGNATHYIVQVGEAKLVFLPLIYR